MNPLPLKFYQGDTEKVARKLLGKKLCHLNEGRLTSGRIIETEAYLGLDDPACHSFGGRHTPRVQSLYKSAGHAYVYMIYGLHFCFNVVTQTSARPEAVLIRALRPVDGVETMQKRRKIKIETQLCSGPGKLCQALGIDRTRDGLSLLGPEVWIEDDPDFKVRPSLIRATPRIGIDYAGEAKDWPLRFTISPEKS